MVQALYPKAEQFSEFAIKDVPQHVSCTHKVHRNTAITVSNHETHFFCFSCSRCHGSTYMWLFANTHPSFDTVIPKISRRKTCSSAGTCSVHRPGMRTHASQISSSSSGCRAPNEQKNSNDWTHLSVAREKSLLNGYDMCTSKLTQSRQPTCRPTFSTYWTTIVFAWSSSNRCWPKETWARSLARAVASTLPLTRHSNTSSRHRRLQSTARNGRCSDANCSSWSLANALTRWSFLRVQCSRTYWLDWLPYIVQISSHSKVVASMELHRQSEAINERRARNEPLPLLHSANWNWLTAIQSARWQR